MNNFKIKVIHGRKAFADCDKPSPIEIRVYLNARYKYISTSICVLPSQFHDGIIVNHPDAFSFNEKISKMVESIERYAHDVTRQGRTLILGDIALALRHEVGSKNDFIKWVDERSLSRNDIRDSTRHSHRRLLSTLKEFQRIMCFSDLTKGNIRAFDDWLHGRKLRQSSVACYHKIMKVYIHDAMDMGFLQDDPYKGFRYSKGKSRMRRYLTEKEMLAIAQYIPADASTQRAKDLFTFQMYTGLAYSDMMEFDYTQIREINGRRVLRDIRRKTEEVFYLVLLSPAIAVLEKYNYKLPRISNQKYNYALKALGAGAGIATPLTSHVARHTFATWSINHGIPIETLATMMGHSNTSTTAIYAKIVNNTTMEAFDKLESVL